MTSCTPSGGGRRSQNAISSDENTSPFPNTSPTTASPIGITEEVAWFSEGLLITGPLLINASINTVVYIRGTNVHNFLSVEGNFMQQYCLVVNFNLSSALAKKQLRMHLSPFQFTNVSTGEVEKLFRADIEDNAGNSALCRGLAPFQVPAGPLTNITDPEIAYGPDEVCPSCSSIVTSTDLKIFKILNGSITGNEVEEGSLDSSPLVLKIDTSNTTEDPNGSCTDESCQKEGFDCCIGGQQCVNDGTVKGTFPGNLEFLQAQQDVAQNPQNYRLYPEFFHICEAPTINTPVPTATPDNEADAEARLKGLIFDLYCLQDFETSQDTTNCFTDNQCTEGNFSVAQLSLKDFTTVNTTNCTNSYAAVKDRVYALCGCVANSQTPAPGDPATVCPDYSLKAIVGLDGIIQDVECDIPPPIIEPTPIQFLNTGVSGRRAPHRFFKREDGEAIDSIQALLGTPDTLATPYQEGEPFAYLDTISKVVPQQDSFSMNAVLGQMNLNLNQALPALQVPVRAGQQYVILVNSGGYTPCPQCETDNWFDTFFSKAPSTLGEGLSAFGYTTSRDSFSENINRGNYEDTLFGRACFLPPTMIPFSHKAEANVQTQRLNRLKTQAAMFINGYKRDWFGFNQGALIGSFNGVTWFSIGRSRKIQASSNKLFLAINAPYADVAEATDTNVSVIEDNSSTSTAPSTDFNDLLSVYDSNQNRGATCQGFHQCTTDADCVNQLGWEYMCADIGSYRTLWPKFDLDGQELANESRSSSYAQIIEGGTINNLSNSRCVYRGAGAPCKKNYSTLSKQLRKLYTCAPNFYCASLTENFNDKINRSVVNQGSIKFGQGAAVLGRPINYVGGVTTLPVEVQDNIAANGANQEASLTSTEVGLCRPGKFLDTNNVDPNFVEQHQDDDNTRRTDYISQIGSCDSTAFGATSLSTAIKRTQTCPLIDNDGNYLYTKDNVTNITVASTKDAFWQQNSCGGEAIRTGSSQSPFAALEGGILGVSATLTSESFAKDACFRRAGSICFTNYDCAPNNLHSLEASSFGVEFFGGTIAEKNYWDEGLVCGQRDEQPRRNDPDFFDYDLRLNKCCRPVGEEITMYTQGDPGTASLNPNLDVTSFSVGDPDASGRYSRYTINGQLQTTDTDVDAAPFSAAPIMPAAGDSPIRFQWKTINDTATNTCCGGGWIRKFSDGTNDWNNPNRLNINPTNMSCINYNTSIALEKPDKISQSAYDRDFFKLCQDPTQNGCVNVSMQDTSGFGIVNPVFDLTFGGLLELVGGARVANLNTFVFEAGTPEAFQEKSFLTPFQPQVVDGDGIRDGNSTENFFQSGFEYVSIQLPNYINDRLNIANVYSTDTEGEKNQIFINCEEAGLCTFCDPATNQATEWIEGVIGDNRNWWCYNESTGIMHAKRARQAPGSMPPLGLYIEFFPVNTPDHRYGPRATPVIEPFKTGVFQPGNDLYYLTKLARFELTGIPQIFYEPIYCNSNSNDVVSGLYKDDAGNEITTRTQFETTAYFYDGIEGRLSQIYDRASDGVDFINSILVGGDQLQFVVNEENVSVPPVFSSHEFKCCLNLGSETQDATACCSNFAAERSEQDATQVCKLPTFTNLSVYFNRFVSGDGQNEDPSIGLTDDDFIPTTGEPKMQTSTYQKLFALGAEHCENAGVRVGSAFGEFTGEPNGGNLLAPLQNPLNVERRYGFVDSVLDLDPSFTTPPSPRTLAFFNAGFRWNHHVYCTDVDPDQN